MNNMDGATQGDMRGLGLAMAIWTGVGTIQEDHTPTAALPRCRKSFVELSLNCHLGRVERPWR